MSDLLQEQNSTPNPLVGVLLQLKNTIGIQDPIMRISAAAFLSVFTTFGILWVMQILIATGEGAITSKYQGRFVDFVRIKKDESLDTKNAKPKKPPEPEEQPPEPEQQMDDIDTSMDTISIGSVDASADINAGMGGFSASEGEYLPIVKVAPQYPNRALSRGIEGYCIVEFVVTRNGSTANPEIVECTSSLFARASIKAASKFKYKPRVMNGTPIDVGGVQNKITFTLEKD
jgi:protein TonB